MDNIKKSIFFTFLIAILGMTTPVHADDYLYDYDYYDTYEPGYNDTDYSDDWFYDYYDTSDAFSADEYDLEYDWIENEYEWEEQDLFEDDEISI